MVETIYGSNCFELGKTALSDKGSGSLAAADVIPVIAVPKGHMILNAGIEVDTATDGSTFTVDLGTGVDPDVFVDGFDATSGASGSTKSCSYCISTGTRWLLLNDNIDVTIATLSGGAVTSGKFRIWALLMDCSDMGSDMVADEVDRDTLA